MAMPILSLRHMVTTTSALALIVASPMLSAQQSVAPSKNPAPGVPESKPPTASALQKMRKKEDKIQGITWLTDKSTPEASNRSNVHLYIGQKETQVWLRWKLQYASESWLFVNRYIVAADDKRFERRARFERDHHATIWEWSDTVAGPSELEIVQAVINAKEVTIRYIGNKYHDDRKVSPQEKLALKNVLEAYVALGGKL